ncbi:MAG: putative S-layer protein [Nanoarchaeota archaeon]
MKSKILSLISLSILSLVLMVSCVSADVLAEWDLTSTGAGEVIIPKHENVTADALITGEVILEFYAGAPFGAYASGWSLVELDDTKYFQIRLNPKTDSGLTISEINFEIGKTIDGPQDYQVQWSKESDFSSPKTIATENLGTDAVTGIDKSITGLDIKINEDEEIYIRLFGYNANNAGGTLRINDNTLQVQGTATANPSLTISSTNELTKIQNGTVNVTNNGNVILEGIDLEVVSTADFEVLFDNEAPFNLNPGESIEVEIYSTNIDGVNFDEDRAFTIKATDSVTESNTLDYKVPMDFYEGENKGELDVSDIEFDVLEGFGDDEEYWYPFDEIEVTFNVDNEGKYDIQDIEIQVCLWDEDAKECILDEDDMEIDKDKFDLDDGDDRDVVLTFKIDAKDLTAGNSDYIFYVKAIGEIDGSKAKDDGYDGDETGDSDSQDNIEIRTDDNFVILDDFEINGMTLNNLKLVDAVACGTELQIVADVWNIGDRDEDDVTVLIKNNELGINKKVLIDNINDFDDEKLETMIEIPENAEAGEYTIDFLIYDEDNDLFENDEDDKAIFKVMINVEGNCKIINSATITAALTSEAEAGEQLIVKTTITNTEDKTVTYVLNVKDYEEWATLEDVEKTLTLVAGESREVTLTFNVNKGVSGNKVFNIETISDSEIVTTQPVSVSIESQKSLLGISLPQNNLYLWGIGIINVILILSIIVVAIRLSKD